MAIFKVYLVKGFGFHRTQVRCTSKFRTNTFSTSCIQGTVMGRPCLRSNEVWLARIVRGTKLSVYPICLLVNSEGLLVAGCQLIDECATLVHTSLLLTLYCAIWKLLFACYTV